MFIRRVVENVEGVFLMKPRSDEPNYGDQDRMDDPYGHDVGGKGYIGEFLKGRNEKGSVADNGLASKGYRYVEAIEEKDGKRHRYAVGMKEVTRTTRILIGGDGKTQFTTRGFVLDKVPACGAAPRYGVTYDDISTREDSDCWIAGSSLKVIDLNTNKVMAERIVYMMDRGQRNTSGGRAPWLLAADTACSDLWRNTRLARSHRMNGASVQAHQTEDFVESILSTDLEK